MKNRLPLLIFLLFAASATFAQKVVDQDKYSIILKQTDQAPVIDGVFDEACWASGAKIKDLNQKFPRLDAPPIRQTEAIFLHDDKNIYIAVTCFDTSYQVTQSLKRDSRIRSNDGVSIIIDPKNQGIYGYAFSVTSAGVQGDAIIMASNDEPDFAWDQGWKSAVKVYNTYYTIEFAIPLATMRFNASDEVWGLNVIRSDQKNNQFSTWTPMVLQVQGFDLGYSGAMRWDVPPKPPKLNTSIIPYALAGYGSEGGVADKSIQTNFGTDIKVAITPQLNLDLTLRPDFSNVDVDEQQTNLTRFGLSYPERRQFFLENSDLFGGFGFEEIRPFFTRRIGLDNNLNPVPMQYGARLNGNLTDGLRIGILNTQTGATTESASQNYSVAVFQQQLGGRSSIKGLFANRVGVQSDGKFDMNDFGRNGGLELSYINQKNTTNAWMNGHLSQSATQLDQPFFFQTGFIKRIGQFQLLLDVAGLGDGYRADMGFVPRLEYYDDLRDTLFMRGSFMSYMSAQYFWQPAADKKITQHKIEFESFSVRFTDMTFSEQWNRLSDNFAFKNSASIEMGFENYRVSLPYPFRFTESGEPLPIGVYNMPQLDLLYLSDRRPLFTWSARTVLGRFYGGNRATGGVECAYRIQPWGAISTKVEYNSLQFGDPYGDAAFWLVSPKVDLSLNRSLFFTGFLQYNTQQDNVNFNGRVQWRYAPMSDVFLVYTDNYFPGSFVNKSRGIVLKVNYWLGLSSLKKR
jgi:Domain of unknown function (DUF5916)/Carbohydrate family 9 binding domain-like